MVFERWPAEDESKDLMPDPADPAYNRYLSQLAGLRAAEREARAAMDEADRQES
jgi:hypothetical protein